MVLSTTRFHAGFSLVELLAVLFISLILASVALISFTAARRNIKTNIAANITISILQQARLRAITNRQPHQVTITRGADSSGLINLITVSAIITNPDNTQTTTIIRQEYLPQDVAIQRPAAAIDPSDPTIPRPPPEVTFSGAADYFVFYYNIDGSATTVAPGPAGNPFTGSIFFSDRPVGSATSIPAGNLPLTRGISIYGSTGNTKYWFYDGTKFVSGIRNY